MKYLLDTNTCIYLMKNDNTVLNTFHSKSKDGAAISAITLSELEYGVHNSPDEYKERNRYKLATFLMLVTVIPYAIEATYEYGIIRAALKRKAMLIGPLDMLIAAHAKALDMTVVTNNASEFARVDGLNVEDWTKNCSQSW